MLDRRAGFALLISLLLLSGCRAGIVSAPAQPAPTVSPAAPTAAAARPAAARTTAAGTVPAAPDFLSIPRAQPYQNCSRQPGVPGCDPTAPVIAGRAAYADPSGKLVVVDLSSGAGWQIPLPGAAGLRWSPDGSRLLLELAGDPRQYAVLDAGGALLEQFAAEYAAWMPDGSLRRGYGKAENRVVAADGRAAWLDENLAVETLNLNLAYPDGRAVMLPLKMNPPAGLFHLYAWVPNSENLLAFRGQESAANSVMIGSEIYWIDTLAQTLRPTGLFGHPAEPNLCALQGETLALVARVPELMPFGRLALLDGRSGKARFPLPESAVTRELAWQPGSPGGLAVALMQRSGEPPAIAEGVHLYNVDSGESRVLILAEPGWRDGALRWTQDGQVLLYAHYQYEGDSRRASLMAYRLSDGARWTLVKDLPAPQQLGPFVQWEGTLAVALTSQYGFFKVD